MSSVTPTPRRPAAAGLLFPFDLSWYAEAISTYLYKALIEANVSEATATDAAQEMTPANRTL